MEIVAIPEQRKKFEIPGRVAFADGRGGLPKIELRSAHGAAEIYFHGAQITGFRKHGEAPLLFLSARSRFVAGTPIRGGVPICFPWFGPRPGDGMHGFARIAEWELTETAVTHDGGTKARFKLPPTDASTSWPPFDAEFTVTVTDRLTMELAVTNASSDRLLTFEACLHTYFAVGDIRDVIVSGLKGVHYLDKTEDFKQKLETAATMRITERTDRVYLDAAGTVEIHDRKLGRTVRVEKRNSASTVVWNPWTTQPMPDFDPAEYLGMLCVESGNVTPNDVTLAPGTSAVMSVTLGSQPIS